MYGELIIGLNMMFNFTVLSFANKMQNISISLRRLCFASFIGAVPVVFFSVSIWTIVLPFLCMTFIAYGKAFHHWRRFATVVLIGALFAGGLLTALQNQLNSITGYQTIFISAVIAYGSLYFFKNKWLNVRTAERLSELITTSTLSLWGKDIPITVLVDSGNSCVEPLSGKAVHFISYRIIEPFLTEELKAFLVNWDPTSTAQIIRAPERYKKEIRLVKLVTVQGESWAIGLQYKKWILKGGVQLDPGYIVLTKDDQRYPEGAEAILHVSAMEKLQRERGTEHVQ